MKSNIIMYNSDDGKINVELYTDDSTIWLNQKQIAELFDVQVPAISKHINNILCDKELDVDAVVSNLETTANDGKTYDVAYYNLKMVLAIGEHTKSPFSKQKQP